VLPSHAQGLRLLVERSFAQAGLELNVIADIDSLPTLISAAREGLACTILSRSALMSPDRLQRLTIRRLVEPGIRRPVGLCWSNSLPRTSAAIAVQQTIVDLAEELVGDQTWGGASLQSVTASAGKDAG
jgi:LysR family transcriptional regulator, nitrogen assimilation regulatory protein